MNMKTWALKVSELKSLSRDGQLLLAARCVLRVAPWAPQPAELWREGLEHVTRCAFQEADTSTRLETLNRELSNQGADAHEEYAESDEILGQCINYAACSLAAAVEATSLEDGPALRKAVVEVAKQSASIAAVLAHGGRVSVAEGEDPVDVACLAAWDAIRADVAVLEAQTAAIGEAGDLQALETCAPLWIGDTPTWAQREKS